MKQSLKIIAMSVLATGLTIQTGRALAEPASQNVSIVRTADLDLSTAAGRRQLDRRLAHAAQEVCGTESDVDIAGKNDVRNCRSSVLANARGQIGLSFAGRQRGATAAVAATGR